MARLQAQARSTITSSSTGVIDFAALRAARAKREAQEFERTKRQEAAKEAERREALGRAPLTWGAAASRYWDGDRAASQRRRLRLCRSLEWLTREIGEATPLHDGERLGDCSHGREAERRWGGTGYREQDRNRTATPGDKAGEAWGEHLPPIEWPSATCFLSLASGFENFVPRKRQALFEALRAGLSPHCPLRSFDWRSAC